jgi:hypothetical protein
MKDPETKSGILPDGGIGIRQPLLERLFQNFKPARRLYRVLGSMTMELEVLLEMRNYIRPGLDGFILQRGPQER